MAFGLIMSGWAVVDYVAFQAITGEIRVLFWVSHERGDSINWQVASAITIGLRGSFRKCRLGG